MALRSAPRVFAGLALSPAILSRHDRAEWPTANTETRQALASPVTTENSPVPSRIVDLLCAELTQCNPDLGYLQGTEAFVEAGGIDPNRSSILRNLYVRSRRQPTVWDIYQCFVSRGVRRQASLTLPINVLRSTRETALLGPGDEATFRQFERQYPSTWIPPRPREREYRLVPTGTSGPPRNVFGFWLPHGLSQDSQEFETQLQGRLQRFEEIEQAFMEVEGL